MMLHTFPPRHHSEPCLWFRVNRREKSQSPSVGRVLLPSHSFQCNKLPSDTPLARPAELHFAMLGFFSHRLDFDKRQGRPRIRNSATETLITGVVCLD